MLLNQHLPSQITKISVYSNNVESGLLTQGSVHNYQPFYDKQHVSLTMTKNSMDDFSSRLLHPIFSQNLQESFNRRFIAKKLSRYANVNDMYLLALECNEGPGMVMPILKTLHSNIHQKCQMFSYHLRLI